MKMNKILLTIFMFLVTIILFTIVPNKVFAAIPEGMSQEFKNILNEEGQLVVKDTTMLNDKLAVVREYLSKFGDVQKYSFYALDYDENLSKCTITRNIFDSTTPEQYEIEVVFEEEYSENFKSILKNGKLEIRTSVQNNKKDKINKSLIALRNANYRFEISNYYDGSKSTALINEECTKATIGMRKNSDGRLVEQHIVEIVYNPEKSNEFKAFLNKDGKIQINGVKPTDEIIFERYFEFLLMKDGEEISYENLSDDFSSCDLTVNGETHNVGIVYNYNNTIKEKMDHFIKNFPSNIEYFNIRDLELINYWVNNVGKNETESLDMFSGELKSYLNYKNMDFYVDNRAGENRPFYTLRLGIAVFKYDNVIYHIDDALGTQAEHVIYVPSETGNTKEELMNAAQKRIDEYLGKKGIVTISYLGTAYEAWARTFYDARIDWPEMDPNMTFEEYLQHGNLFIPTYNNFEDEIGVKGITEDDQAFIATIKVGNKEEKFHIFIKRDTSKMVTPTYKTADITTNIEISSNSSAIPLDTNIRANEITSGAEYERIIKLLDVKESAMFDLKLYSNSLEDYITKLDDGTFEVRIPVPDNLKGKNLVAYYTSSDGKTEEYKVEVKDGYAIFRTNHFSVYTLAENNAETENGNNNNENKNNGNTEINNNNNTNTETNNKTNSKNPRTGDNILVFVGMLTIAIIGIVVTNVLKKKNKAK